MKFTAQVMIEFRSPGNDSRGVPFKPAAFLRIIPPPGVDPGSFADEWMMLSGKVNICITTGDGERLQCGGWHDFGFAPRDSDNVNFSESFPADKRRRQKRQETTTSLPDMAKLSPPQQAECRAIVAALNKFGNKVQAANSLGLHQTTLNKKMEDYGFVPPAYKSAEPTAQKPAEQTATPRSTSALTATTDSNGQQILANTELASLLAKGQKPILRRQTSWAVIKPIPILRPITDRLQTT
jgi:hypothetical protein